MFNNPEDENILDTNLGRAVVGALTNRFDKKTCINCSKCAPKGAVKYYCGYNRRPVESDGGCDHFTVKTAE